MFATQAGIHQSGILRGPITYEYVEASRFGRERTILVGRHSGRSVLRHVFEEKHLPVDDRLVDDLYERYIAERTSGDCVGLAELRRLIAAHHPDAGARD